MDSIGVYWINLKPHLLPCVVQEVDNVVKKHRKYLLSARDGNPTARRNLEFLNVSIRARIEDFDNFYTNHFQDFRMPFFEKQKFRLRRLLAESLAADPNFKEGEELEILTDEQLESARKGAMLADNSYTMGQKSRKSPTKSFMLTQNPVMTRSPIKGGREVREKKRKVIEDSVKRLASPKKKSALGSGGYYDDDELIFSIKMTREEYLQYQKTRDFYKSKKVQR